MTDETSEKIAMCLKFIYYALVLNAVVVCLSAGVIAAAIRALK